MGLCLFSSDVDLCRLSTLLLIVINAWTANDSSLGFENSLCQHLRSEQAAWSSTLDGGSYNLLQRYYATSAGLYSTAKAPTSKYHAKARLQHLRSMPLHQLQQLRLQHLSSTPKHSVAAVLRSSLNQQTYAADLRHSNSYTAKHHGQAGQQPPHQSLANTHGS